MELMFSYFWLIKLTTFLVVVWLGYKGIKKTLKNKKIVNIYNLGFVGGLLFLVMSPIKMDVGVKSATDYANNQIEQNKVLPEMVKDDNFKTKSDAIEGITKEDME